MGEREGAQQAVSTQHRTSHARTGHDAGCELLGVPLRLLAWLARAGSGSGTGTGSGSSSSTGSGARLLDEAISECLAELDSLGPSWTPVRAREAVEAAVRSRITPAHLAETTVGPQRSR